MPVRGRTVLLCQFCDLLEFGKNIGIASGAVGNKTVGAIFDSLFGVPEVSTASVAQSVERTVAEQTVKIVTVCVVAGEILTFPVLEKAMIVLFHGFPLLRIYTSRLMMR